MIYLFGLDIDNQKLLQSWLETAGLGTPTEKAAVRLADLQKNLEESSPEGNSEDFSKILLTQGKSLFRQHRSLATTLWPLAALEQLNFWLEVDPNAKALLHFDLPETTLARQLHRDQRNAYRAEQLQNHWQRDATQILELLQSTADRCLLIHGDSLQEHTPALQKILEERWEVTLSPPESTFEALTTPTPVEQLLAGGLLLDHLDIQEMYAELLAQCTEAPAHQYHETRFVEMLRLHWDDYAQLESTNYLEREQTKQQDGLKEAEEENELLLLQLHQVQEELEHYFLEYKKLSEPRPQIQNQGSDHPVNRSRSNDLAAKVKRKLRLYRDRWELSRSGLFDEVYYLQQNPDVANSGLSAATHYLEFGWQEKRQPHPHFDGELYLGLNPDVRAAGINPVLHWHRNGRTEGRPGA